MKTRAPSPRLGSIVLVSALVAFAPSLGRADGPSTGGTINPAQIEGRAAAVDDVRKLPIAPEWKPGDPITVRPPMRGRGGQAEAPAARPQPEGGAPAAGP